MIKRMKAEDVIVSEPWRPLPKIETAEALESADLRVLLMVMHHLTGDEKWLSAPFAPQRDVNLISDLDAGLSDEAQRHLKTAALDLLTSETLSPAIHDPGEALMQRMISTCLGEAIPSEYNLMLREEMGFQDRGVDWRCKTAPPPVVIVGAGPSGLITGKRLVDMGVPYIILEKNEEVGGTWFENRYPGCAVDTPNHAYSFSFGRRQDWSRYFSPQSELLSYMVERSHEFGVRDNIRFQHELTGAEWDDKAGRWRCFVRGPDGDYEIEALALVSAIGPLSKPRIKRFDGDESFSGTRFHSAEWPGDVDLKGKHVAVIGTGASSMQICPTIAADVASLTIYQRTPQWARFIPRFKEAMPKGARWLLQNVPYYGEWFRATMLWRYGDGLLRTLRRDPDWDYPERSMNRINDRHREQMANHILSELDGRPDLIEQAMPDYPPYGKRILLDNGWFRMLRRDNVELVTDSVQRFEPSGVVAGDALCEADVVVLATGFDVTQSAARLNLIGRGGVDLAEQWADEEITAYIGITAPNFPNFFICQGPGTGLAHGGSAIFTSECQIRYITGCIAEIIDRDAVMEVREEVHDNYMDRLNAEHRELIWAHPGLTTYYRNKNGRVISIMPWRLVDFWEMSRAPNMDDFHVRSFG